MMKTRRRTALSFLVFFSLIVLFMGVWTAVSHLPEDEDLPPAFRRVLELNGQLWQKLYRPQARAACQNKVPAGKVPRVNGKIGLIKDLDPALWKMKIVVDDQDPQGKKFEVNLKDIMALPRSQSETEFRCIEGWSDDITYAGVKFSDFIKAYHIEMKAFVGFETVDGEYYVSVDRDSMLHDQTMLAYEMNGQPLKVLNGAPLRLIIPVKYGIKHIKQIGKIIFSDQRPRDYWAEQGYDWFAGL